MPAQVDKKERRADALERESLMREEERQSREVESIKRANDIPNRYLIREDEKGHYITCIEAPGIEVRVERGLVLSGAHARKFPPGTIFLDGAAMDGPFLDNEKLLYNLDHHDGCVRSFTLASCEQALVMVSKGIRLKERDWTVYANDPDLDTLFAIWILLNHTHLNRDNSPIRSAITPLIRLEGVIDAHGLDLQFITGFSDEKIKRLHSHLDELQEQERSIKREGRWGEIDYYEYTAHLLHQIDKKVYRPWDFGDFKDLEELERVSISAGKICALCRSDLGIYEVEEYLQRIYEKRLGMIVLEKAPGLFSLRQVDLFLPIGLDQVYDRLNLIDRAAATGRQGNRWGGSVEIGGSPRRTGSKLSIDEIADAISRAHRRLSPIEKIKRIATASLTAVALFALSWIATTTLHSIYHPPWSLLDLFVFGKGDFAVVLLLLSSATIALLGWRRPWLYGLKGVSTLGWLYLLPVALIMSIFGGGWFIHSQDGWQPSFLVLLIYPLAAEILFRGFVQGRLAIDFPIQSSESPFFLSIPNIISALLYAIASLPFLFTIYTPYLHYLQVWIAWPLHGAAAFAFGLYLGAVRERGESLLISIACHWLAIAAALFLLNWM